ncbi:hypothetical protein F2P81_012102 [Scophthalmus maximus]|uniref:Uncharacterized protein n=1 Tax=Scophthalmus maximus TaxID=52904 RepID=A0A6A4SY76_SCOMX|nr:hypothetical protein F2P81_012102 [Scophthalmus maximus]
MQETGLPSDTDLESSRNTTPPGTWNQFGKRENENKTSVELIHKAGPLVIVFPKRVMSADMNRSLHTVFPPLRKELQLMQRVDLSDFSTWIR